MIVQQASAIKDEMLKVLSYYNIFRHPLLPEEIHRFIHVRADMNDVLATLRTLEEEKEVFCYYGYYGLADNASLAEKRIAGERRAAVELKKAVRAGRIISYFPFVRFVGISGSLSKHYADDNTDYDFFIVTTANRLWIARTLLHIFKKLTFLAGRQHAFCMNYFVDETALAIEDRNSFVAYEIATLIPVYNQAVYTAFMQSNSWIRQEMPQYRDTLTAIYNNRPWLQRFSEWCSGILPLNRLNTMLMQVTDRRWRKKWHKQQFPADDYELAFRTRINVSKNHPRNHQKMVLAKLAGTSHQVL